ncbi:MAG: YfiR family protein [Candidatus Zixiibacteriota bacterium]|nr:MAG: YfiR family protein [candidate division Zixibacteria bacterium]
MKKSLVILSVLLLAVFAGAQADTDKEITRKAEFIIGLIDNVQWSDDRKPGDEDEILIYVVGESPVTPKLEELAEKESAEGSTITVKVVSEADDLTASHILFLPSDDVSLLAKVLKKVKNSPTVTVADAKDFARYGAMIAFFNKEDDSDIHYEINRLVVESAGLTISSKIMDKAELI